MRHDYNNSHIEAEICGDVGTGSRPYRDTCTTPEERAEWQREDREARFARNVTEAEAARIAKRDANPINWRFEAATALVRLHTRLRMLGHYEQAAELRALQDFLTEQGKAAA